MDEQFEYSLTAEERAARRAERTAAREERRRKQRMQLFKNLALGGGICLVLVICVLLGIKAYQSFSQQEIQNDPSTLTAQKPDITIQQPPVEPDLPDLPEQPYSLSANERTVTIGGQESARFMVLIGKGTGLTGAGYDVRPDWEANYAIAERITASLNEQADRLGRSICLRTGRFNQHIAPCSVLIECGSNHNTLQEVLTGVPYLAQAIADALSVQ